MSGTKQNVHKEIQYHRKSNNASENLERNINDVLPNEIFIHCILKHLDFKGLDSVSLTCKKWNNFVHSYFLWKGNFSPKI